jgi:microcin C transport system ATP-binding protein
VQGAADAGAEGEHLTEPLLSIDRLSVRFGAAAVVDDVSFEIAAGEKFALVGESGSGKSITALSILGLVDGAETTGAIRFAGRDLRQADEPELRAVRGGEIAMIFQEPMTALNPLHTVGAQIGEVLALHAGLGRAAARSRAIELLDKTGIPEPERRVDAWPHQLSGGQRQRAMIAMALAGGPSSLSPTSRRPRSTSRSRRRSWPCSTPCRPRWASPSSSSPTTSTWCAASRTGRRDGAGRSSRPARPSRCSPRRSTRTRSGCSRAGRAAWCSRSPAAAPRLIEARGLASATTRLAAGFAAAASTRCATATLALARGETLGIVGESGSGKTTLGMALLALQPIADGSVALDGAPLGTDPSRAARCDAGCRSCSRIRSARSARA